MRLRKQPFTPKPGTVWLVAAGKRACFDFVKCDGVVLAGDMVQLNVCGGGICEVLAARIQGARCILATTAAAPEQMELELGIPKIESNMDLAMEVSNQYSRGGLEAFLLANYTPAQSEHEARAEMTRNLA